MGMLSFLGGLFSCVTTAKKEKVKEKLAMRIDEISEEKFLIEKIWSGANEGNMDFSLYNARLRWEKDKNVMFSFLFRYKNDQVDLKKETFEEWFFNAKSSMEKTYALQPLIENVFKSLYKYEVIKGFGDSTYKVNLFVEYKLLDTTLNENIESLRSFVEESATLLEANRIIFRAYYVNDLNKIPASEFNDKIYAETIGNNSYLTSAPYFKYQSDLTKEKGFVSEMFGFNEFSSMATGDLKEAVDAKVKSHEKYEQGDYFKVDFENNQYVSRVDTNYNHVNVEWQSFYTYLKKDYKEQNNPSKKITGKINIYTKEIVLD